MDLQLGGKTALVTGASTGLGFAAAAALAAEGAEVHIVSRSRERITAAGEKIRATGGSAVEHTADLSDGKEIGRLLAEVPSPDILISNTGGPPAGTLDSFNADDWREQYTAIFESALRLSSGVAPAMGKQGWGRIIYITSVSILTPLSKLGFSNALRAGIAGLAKTQAIEWGKGGVTVNCIAPGLFATDRLKELNRDQAAAAGISMEEQLRRKGEAVPAGRIGQPGELGALAAFLASPKAGYLNGLVLPIDGGKHL